MSNARRPEPTNGGRQRTDLDPDEANVFGPDAPNTRPDDPPAGEPPEAPPPQPPSAVLEEGDFAPDET